jgi:hypothetical protein
MNDNIILNGKIIFDPIDMTNKHKSQSSWKKVAMVMFEGDVSEYYAWFIKKRFNLKLNSPMRGAHISFINDSQNDFIVDNWEEGKRIFDGKDISVEFNRTVNSNGKHWWFRVDPEKRSELHAIRSLVGLPEMPHFGLHLSIGYANDKYIEHSKYLNNLVLDGYLNEFYSN